MKGCLFSGGHPYKRHSIPGKAFACRGFFYQFFSLSSVFVFSFISLSFVQSWPRILRVSAVEVELSVSLLRLSSWVFRISSVRNSSLAIRSASVSSALFR